MAPVSTIGLFEVDPDFARYVPLEDRPRAEHVRLPVTELAAGEVDVRALLRSGGAFAAILVDGMLVQSMRLEGRSGLRLLGPGAIMSLAATAPSMLVDDSDVRATVPTRVVLLGRDFLVASRHWPWLVAGLNARHADQSRALANQLMICQLPRVDDRLLAIMWLLADSWGRVSSAGTMLPIQLTHSVLGGLIGARRPTVSLALRALTDSGSLVRQSDGWLLLKPPPTGPAIAEPALPDPRPVEVAEPVAIPSNDEPVIAADTPQTNHVGVPDRLARIRLTRDAAAYDELLSTVARLRAEHDIARARTRDRLEAFASARASATQRRKDISERRQTPRTALP